jgi:hypothetical protein
VDEPGYVPPPAFAPPAQRVAPLNEVAVLGRSSYPPGLYPQPAPAWFPPPPPPPLSEAHLAKRQRHVSVVVSVAVVAALIAIGAVLISGATARDPRSLSLPRSVDEYTQVSTLTGPQVQHVLAGGSAFGSLPSTDLDSAKVGVYSALGEPGPSMVFIGFDADESPTLGSQLHHTAADVVAAQVLVGAGAGAGVQHADAGPLGGALQCATIDLSGQSASVGVWADHDTLGIVLIVDSTLTAHGAARSIAHATHVTRDFRAAAEH